jgi:hypothetical protein
MRNVSCMTVVKLLYKRRDIEWVPCGIYVVEPTTQDPSMSLESCTTIAQLLCNNYVPKKHMGLKKIGSHVRMWKDGSKKWV